MHCSVYRFSLPLVNELRLSVSSANRCLLHRYRCVVDVIVFLSISITRVVAASEVAKLEVGISPSPASSIVKRGCSFGHEVNEW